MPLAIRVQFLAGYSGREWPPSPARLFKALVSSARAGWAHSNRKAIDDSLRALEQQGWTGDTKLPDIVAPRAEWRPPRQRRFVPNNSKNWPIERKLNPEKGIDLEPEAMVGWDIEAPHTVWYWWPNVEASHVSVIREVSRRVASVGKGEDLAVLDATEAEPPGDAVRWQSASSGASLEVPEAGCLDVCDATFARGLHELPLLAAGVRSVAYASDARSADREVPTFVLGLWRNGKRCSLDARLLRQVVGPVLHLLDGVRAEVVHVLARGPGDRPSRATSPSPSRTSRSCRFRASLVHTRTAACGASPSRTSAAAMTRSGVRSSRWRRCSSTAASYATTGLAPVLSFSQSVMGSGCEPSQPARAPGPR